MDLWEKTTKFSISSFFIIFCLPIFSWGLAQTQKIAAEPFEYKLLFAENQKGFPSGRCNFRMCRNLLNLINKAKVSIDFAIYGIRNQRAIFAALVSAKNRGVRIRGLVDTHNNFCGKLGEYTYKDTGVLIESLGGPSIVHCDSGPGYSYIMHNKFFIFDEKTVWTGSTNISDTGIGGEFNANVSIILPSKNIAKIYTQQFENLYKGRPRRKEKSPGNYKQVWNDGTEVQVFFSPSDDPITFAINKLIEESQNTLFISMFFLTHFDVAEKIIAAKNRGVEVRMILDGAGSAHASSQKSFLCEQGIRLKVENWRGKMHMKLAVADYADPQKGAVIIGSQNWTINGNKNNDENTLYIKNPSVADEVAEEFLRLWRSLYMVPECR